MGLTNGTEVGLFICLLAATIDYVYVYFLEESVERDVSEGMPPARGLRDTCVNVSCMDYGL